MSKQRLLITKSCAREPHTRIIDILIQLQHGELVLRWLEHGVKERGPI